METCKSNRKILVLLNNVKKLIPYDELHKKFQKYIRLYSIANKKKQVFTKCKPASKKHDLNVTSKKLTAKKKVRHRISSFFP